MCGLGVCLRDRLLLRCCSPDGGCSRGSGNRLKDLHKRSGVIPFLQPRFPPRAGPEEAGKRLCLLNKSMQERCPRQATRLATAPHRMAARPAPGHDRLPRQRCFKGAERQPAAFNTCDKGSHWSQSSDGDLVTCEVKQRTPTPTMALLLKSSTFGLRATARPAPRSRRALSVKVRPAGQWRARTAWGANQRRSAGQSGADAQQGGAIDSYCGLWAQRALASAESPTRPGGKQGGARDDDVHSERAMQRVTSTHAAAGWRALLGPLGADPAQGLRSPARGASRLVHSCSPANLLCVQASASVRVNKAHSWGRGPLIRSGGTALCSLSSGTHKRAWRCLPPAAEPPQLVPWLGVAQAPGWHPPRRLWCGASGGAA